MPRRTLYLACLLLAGCAPTPPKGFDSPVPAARLEAVFEAAREEDRTKIPDLIGSLRSDDPAVRLFAMRTLQQLTGETLGYHYADPEGRRENAVQRWIDWYEDRADSGPGPADRAEDTPEDAPENADDT